MLGFQRFQVFIGLALNGSCVILKTGKRFRGGSEAESFREVRAALHKKELILGCSSVGRASALHAERRGFDSSQLRQNMQYGLSMVEKAV